MSTVTLLSLILPSYMVASIRELVNTSFLSPSNLQSTKLTSPTSQQINIEMNKTKDWSVSPSSNSSKELSIHSNLLSMYYVERVKALTNCLTCTK